MQDPTPDEIRERCEEIQRERRGVRAEKRGRMDY
jgi:hypothetical protein